MDHVTAGQAFILAAAAAVGWNLVEFLLTEAFNWYDSTKEEK